jgi:hypothetical protein
MNRRELIRTAVLGAGVTTAAAAQQHQHTQLTTIAPAQAAGMATEAWAPAVLDAHQNATVIQLSELIIPTTDTPGARDAKVNEWVDLYLADLAEDKGHSFIMGLGWLDGYSLEKHAAPFVLLGESDQVSILEELDGADAEELQPGAKFFAEMKRLTVQGYYTSRIGIAELNKGGVPDTYACTHESHA